MRRFRGGGRALLRSGLCGLPPTPELARAVVGFGVFPPRTSVSVPCQARKCLLSD